MASKSRILAAAILVLVTGTIMQYCWQFLVWHGFHVRFDDYQFRDSSNIKFTTSTALEAPVFVLQMGMIYYLCHSDGLGWHYHTQIFMTISSDIQVMSRVFSHNFRVSGAGITDGRNLWSTLLRRFQMTWYQYHRKEWETITSKTREELNV